MSKFGSKTSLVPLKYDWFFFFFSSLSERRESNMHFYAVKFSERLNEMGGNPFDNDFRMTSSKNVETGKNVNVSIIIT